MKRTGIFGGSFNPIHNGHISLARQLLDKAGLDEIWFVVSPQNPLKQRGQLLDDDKRLQMVKEALAHEPHMTASDYEFHLPRPSYMWDTLQSLSHDYPENQFTLLIGGDNWNCFDRWYHHDDIIRHYPIVIYPRDTSNIDPALLPPHVKLVNTPLYSISSTEIRQRIRNGLSIKGWVPPVTESRILSEGLYR